MKAYTWPSLHAVIHQQKTDHQHKTDEWKMMHYCSHLCLYPLLLYCFPPYSNVSILSYVNSKCDSEIVCQQFTLLCTKPEHSYKSKQDMLQTQLGVIYIHTDTICSQQSGQVECRTAMHTQQRAHTTKYNKPQSTLRLQYPQ